MSNVTLERLIRGQLRYLEDCDSIIALFLEASLRLSYVCCWPEEEGP